MVTINLTNRWLYTFALIIGVFALAVGVYAAAPNPGHTTSEVDFSGTIATLNADQVCLAGDCQTSWPSGGGGSLWTASGSDIYYSGGSTITTVGSSGIETQRPSNIIGLSPVTISVEDANKNTELVLSSGGNPALGGGVTGGRIRAEGGSLYLESSSGTINVVGDLDVGGKFIGDLEFASTSVPLTMFWEICTEVKYQSNYRDEAWCGGPHPYLKVFNTQVFQYECVPFLVDIRQFDEDDDHIEVAACMIDRTEGRIFYRLITTGTDSEFTARGAFCGAICGIPLINV